MDKLIEIRHSKVVTKKKGGVEYQEACNKKWGDVMPGSAGVAFCVKCNEEYSFEVLKNNQSANIYDLLQSVNNNIVRE
jgi:hypothetical protein